MLKFLRAIVLDDLALVLFRCFTITLRTMMHFIIFSGKRIEPKTRFSVDDQDTTKSDHREANKIKVK